MSIYLKYPRLLDAGFVETYDLESSWTAQNRYAEYNDEDIAVALIRYKGNYSATARVFKRSRGSIQNYILHNILLRELRDDVVQEVIDDIEEGYMNDALCGDATARRFFLQTLGKDRGYVVRNESTGKDGTALYKESRIDPTGMSEQALLELMMAEKKGG